jgi:hypothetical protein
MSCRMRLNQKIPRVDRRIFMGVALSAVDCINNGVTVEPTTSDYHTAAAKQDNNNDADDEGSVILLRRFGGNRHFVHDFISWKKWLCKSILHDELYQAVCVLSVRRQSHQSTSANRMTRIVPMTSGTITAIMEAPNATTSSAMLTGTFPAPAVVAVTAGRIATALTA